MGRPRLHGTEHLLDTAAELAAEHGGAGVSMAGVARAAGAPSGTLYNRFESRAALLGALWLRTVTSFQEGFLSALRTESPLEGCVAAARHVVAWSRAHPLEAPILLAGPAELAQPDWPSAVREQVDAVQAELEAALRRVAAALAGDREPAFERVLLVTVDLPYAVVRRRGGRGIPASLETLVEESARAILG